MLISTLEQIGLTENQAKIYVACLELGETTIKEIAQKSGVKRTSIYDFLDEMINSGIIQQTIRGKKKKFIATEPEDLDILLKKREALLGQILPELNSISNVGHSKPKVWFYSGTDGLKKAYEDLLNYKNLTVCGWASEDLVKLLGEEWIAHYIKRRLNRNIDEKIIYPLGEVSKTYLARDKEHHRISKIIDPKKYHFDIEINMYKDRISMVSAKDMVAVIIESKSIVNTFRTIFDICWDNLP